ncbi:hypothetical protein F4808DRAFT_237561 [Astrocystis sublimbata]|nr:hypothetical protein F4808DRAFT_237561 [Astrocystis sublimbata]
MKALSEPIPPGTMRKAISPTKSTQTGAKVTKRRKLHRRLIRPAIGSLYDRMHDHAGLQLFTRPLYWIDLHMTLLSCQFVQLPRHTTPTPLSASTPKSSLSSSQQSLDSQRSLEVPQTVVMIGRNLDILMDDCKLLMMKDSRGKDAAMTELMNTLYPGYFTSPRHHVELDLLFGSHLYRAVANVQLLWHSCNPQASMMSFDSTTTRVASQPVSRAASITTPSIGAPGTDSSILVYVNRSHLDFMRRNFFRNVRAPNGTINEPVARLQALRSKALIPKNAVKDPYFLGVMLALAQQSVYGDQRAAKGFAPRDVKIRLLTVAEDDLAFIVYTATVPGALLSMFHEPNKAPPANPDFAVHYCHVNVWPVLGLKERLGKALGSDLVGEYGDAVIDTYEELATPVPEEGRSKKRGREALSEVFNGSFSDDRSESPSPSPSTRKKQRMDGKTRSCSVMG